MTAAAQKTILVMAGGTGGHVFPALAVADVLRDNGFRVVWLGTRKGIEARLVPAAGIDVEWVPVEGLRGKGAMTLLLAPFRLARAVFSAWRSFRRMRPLAVLGMGGFASGPGGIVAWLTRTPLVIHEQNAMAGFTNRILAKLARHVLVAFPETLGEREECVGNPVRNTVVLLAPPEQRFAGRTGPLRILVLGGSLGARALNEHLPGALGLTALDVEVRHQCGRGDVSEVRAAYASVGINATVESFIDDMAAVYAWADIAVCRAGAMTIFELAAAGLGAVLVPFPYAVDDHQTANADYLAKAGAARVLQERDMNKAALAATLRDLLDRDALQEMAKRARKLARPHATQRVADACMAAAAARVATGGAA